MICPYCGNYMPGLHGQGCPNNHRAARGIGERRRVLQPSLYNVYEKVDVVEAKLDMLAKMVQRLLEQREAA